jgi:hypothetical protein
MKSSIRLVVIFSVAFSLAVLAGPTSSNFRLPTVLLAHAVPEPCQTHGSGGACSQFWYPAGPEMNTELALVFTDSVAEYTNLQSITPSIDFPDSPLPPSQIPPFITNPNFVVTAPVGQSGYYEIQFLLANSFWGCFFDFGNSPCGVQIRQSIAHMIDKKSFTNTDPSIAGVSIPIDNPVPTSAGLTSPSPCSWDASFPETNATTGTQCIVGAAGGTSYHLAAATGADGFPWLPAPGSADLNAAAKHFVNAGLATGFNTTTSVLTGISPAVAPSVPTFFIRNDDPARLHLGSGLVAEICYLFTGSYASPCQYLNVVFGPITAFPGFNTSGCTPFPSPACTTGVNLSWWMYTAAFSGPNFFDGSLYFGYNSRFTNGIPSIQPPNGPCAPQAVPTSSAADYMYLCSPNYDLLSSQMENSPSLSQAVSFGLQAESYFGGGAFTIPIFERTLQFGYLNNGWVRVINDNSQGLPNYFTWLNAWNPAPVQAGTIRQGFSETTRSVNPYIASTVHDLYIVRNVYDSLYQSNPLNPSQQLDWMSVITQQLSNSSLNYIAPAHTLTTYRFTLRPDLYFHDGRPVTAYDVAFSYLSLVGTGANLGVSASQMTGITLLGSHQLDIGMSSTGPFVLPNLTSIPILPGRYWTNAGASAWDSATMTCTSVAGCARSQYTLSGSTVNCNLGCSPFSVSLLTVNPTDVGATFDPIAAHIFVGSGPWQCGTVTAAGSGTCTSTGAENPPVGGSYTLTRFGNGLAPASSSTAIYFRSSGDLALWTWASNGNPLGPNIITVSQVVLCFGQPSNSACAHWQHGMGASMTGIVGINQVSIVMRFFGVNWVAPFNWVSSPPTGIGPFAPVLYEGSVTLNPCSIDPVNGYDC